MITNDTPKVRTDGKSPEELRLLADQLIAGVVRFGLDRRVAQAEPTTWDAGLTLIEDGHNHNPSVERLGYMLALQALSQVPEIWPDLIRDLRAAIVATDPTLARVP